jgi:hypothetical protein
MLPIASKNSIEKVEESLNDLINHENREIVNSVNDVSVLVDNS